MVRMYSVPTGTPQTIALYRVVDQYAQQHICCKACIGRRTESLASLVTGQVFDDSIGAEPTGDVRIACELCGAVLMETWN